ncbi:MAG: hypothetical protein INR73_29455, partial [Williamsia sp.]|nr:hypothetical protein [Williamsia sp.]
MKTIAQIGYLLSISVFVGWLSAGCSHNPNDPSPGNTCRIQQYVSRSSSAGFNTQNQIDYAYDQQGNLTKMVTTFDKQPLSGTVTSQTGSTNVDYVYDANGYLATSTSAQKLTTLFAGKTTIEQTSVTSSYTYAEGRLASSHIRRVGAYGLNTTTEETYQYDSAGDLQKKTSQSTYDYDPAVAKEIPKSPTGALRTWTYQKNQLTDYVETYENTASRPLTIQNGVIT